MIPFFLNPILSSEKLWDFLFSKVFLIYKIWEQKFGINFSLLFALNTYLEERTTVWFRHKSKIKTFVKFGGFFPKKTAALYTTPHKKHVSDLTPTFYIVIVVTTI